MYFQSMSVPGSLEARIALEVIDACDRLLPRLFDVIAQHEHAAAVARPDWSGPHHEAFEERFVAVQRALGQGCTWVVRVRHDAVARLEAAA